MDNLTNGPYDPRTIFCGEELVATIETGHNERDVTYARAFVSAMNEAHKLRAALQTIALYEDYEDMEESAADMGLSYVEYLEMAYDNIRGVALNVIAEEG
jgi:hypothetical protein